MFELYSFVEVTKCKAHPELVGQKGCIVNKTGGYTVAFQDFAKGHSDYVNCWKFRKSDLKGTSVFRINDFVTIVDGGGHEDLGNGKLGVVTVVVGNLIGVRIPGFEDGHDLDTDKDFQDGWWFEIPEIELYKRQ